jgi:sugar transferase (PEP-CTERM/EpsH1 system associated)
MRILFLAHRLPYPPNKGDKIRSFHELQGIAKRHEVDLFCFYDQPEDVRYFNDVRRYCRDLYAEKISWPLSRARAISASIVGRPFTTAFFRSPDMSRRIGEAVRSRNYDLIFLFSSSMASYVEAFSNIPRVLDMVDVDSDKWVQYANYTSPPVSWLWRAEGHRLAAYENLCARRFTTTLLSTDAEAELLIARCPSCHVEVLENRMSAEDFDPDRVPVSPEIAAYQPYVVFTGSMNYRPNVDAVGYFHREIFPLIRARMPKAHFVIVGRNPVRLVRRLAEDPLIHVTGAVADIRPYLRGASAAVAPLRIARGVQTKVIEAMAMGLPVAASRKVSIALPETLRRQVFAEDDPRRIADFLVERLRGPGELCRTLRQVVVDYARNSHWEERLETVLAAAVKSPGLKICTGSLERRCSRESVVGAGIV